MYTVYVLFSKQRNRYYVGFTGDEIAERIRRHNTNHKGFTGGHGDWELKYSEVYLTKEAAQQKTYLLQEAVESLIKNINNQDIQHETHDYHEDNDTMLEISIYDHHFGKLAHKSETGNDYDLKIAQSLYMEAVDVILKRSAGYNLERIMFPIGQDLFHVNNEISTTEGGTFQDTDSRLSKIFETVQMTLISCIDKMLKVAPVDVIYVPDNHGPLNSYFMTKVLEAYYKNNPYVNVDSSPKCRKYYRYGNTLIGMSHGHMEKADILPLTMACEAKYDWCI